MTEDDESTAASAEVPKPPIASQSTDERTVIDAVADLLQTIVDWLRQEAEAVMKDKIVLPLQALGFTLFFGLAASGLIMAGLLMVSIASILWLAEWLTWPGALLMIGGVQVILATVALYFRIRTTQK